MQAPHINDDIRQLAVSADETPDLMHNLTRSATEIARVLLVAVAQSMGPLRDFAHATVQYVLQSYSIFTAWITSFIKNLGENAQVLYAKASLGQLSYDAWDFAISVAIPSIKSTIQQLNAQLFRVMRSISDSTGNFWAEESIRYHCALLKQAIVAYWQDIRPGAQVLLMVHLLITFLIVMIWIDKGRRQADAVMNRIPMILLPCLGSYLVAISGSIFMGYVLVYLKLYMMSMTYWPILQIAVEMSASSVTLWILVITLKYMVDIAYHGLLRHWSLPKPQTQFLHDLYTELEEGRPCLRNLFSKCLGIIPAACIIRMVVVTVVSLCSFLHLSPFQTSDVGDETLELKTAILGELSNRHADLMAEFAQAYAYILAILGMYQLESLAWQAVDHLSPLLGLLGRDLGVVLYLLTPHHIGKPAESSFWPGFDKQPGFDALRQFHYNALFQLEVACCFGSAALETGLEDAARAVSASHELATSIGKTVQAAISSTTVRPVSFGKECVRSLAVFLMRVYTTTVSVLKGVGLLVSVVILLVVSTAAGLFLIAASIPLLVLQFSRLITWTLVNLTLSVIIQGVGALEYLLADVGGRDGLRFMRNGWQAFGARMIAKELSTMKGRMR